MSDFWLSAGGHTVWLLGIAGLVATGDAGLCSASCYPPRPMHVKDLRSHSKTQGAVSGPGTHLGDTEGVTVDLKDSFKILDFGTCMVVFSAITVAQLLHK